ncbi:sigma-54 interaction domain-containing protein [Thermosediminibacter oceani]|uniref:PAS modulated sigma54 specific transcriptional regulator, Fis family n=1 Tax=Thermosediminibacter oceani (strain ATCC BAA-1034 / DSM 16646 / JW/IW-1228P) TaxID=555079 RepID=D9RYJ7_THEOJ|nr:sigma 54-interacting transcriptional regulator [Thermosediminibacter oceani]ADL08421.1 PAS modulated sigma54 specific transcriptional regulator, Fis family [Thermosediminibacter oceani DSM 16646]
MIEANARSAYATFDIPLESILENINEGICVIDRSRRVIYWNRQAEKLYGIKKDQILGRDIVQFFPNALALEVLKTGKPIEYVEHRPREGNVVVISSIPIKKDGELLGVVSIDQDITEIRKLSYELQKARNRIQYLEYVEEEIKKLHRDFNFENIVYKSKTMYDLILLAMKVAESDASVLIQGESGTGKDLFARAIHQGSQRKDKPFVVVDCSSIPESLLESELFGYEPGAFTGAQKKGKPGKFELAEGGTVFLDEIGEMPLEMQSKLLRVLENREFYRVGGVKPVKVNIRIISATNRDLAEMVKQGKFREDLFYRLDVVSLKIPPLRERPEDIPVLIDYYLKKYSVENKKVIDRIEPAAVEMLLNYPWPGNVRELKNVVERLVILAEDGSILAEHLPQSIKKYFENTTRITDKDRFMKLEQVVAEAEKKAITHALKMTGNNKAKAAEMLGIPRSTLYYKIKTLKIECPTD